MGSMYLCFGLSVAALTFAVPKLASESSRRYAAYACIFSAAMLFRQIVSLYTWKTGKYLSLHMSRENHAASKLMLLYMCGQESDKLTGLQGTDGAHTSKHGTSTKIHAHSNFGKPLLCLKGLAATCQLYWKHSNFM